MKKIFISAGLLSVLLCSQVKAQSVTDSTQSSRKLTLEEINFVTSYYRQEGNNSAVTGGVGTEQLKDEAAGFTLKFSKIDKKNRKNIFTAEANIERYSSASSDQIDPSTLSSASSSDIHFYPSLSWTRQNGARTFGISTYFSTEYDYKSYGAGVLFSREFKERNSEFTAKLNLYSDQIMVILPEELRPESYPTGAKGDKEGIVYKPRNSYNVGLQFSKIINPSLQVLVMADPAFQEGLLSMPFHRVYFNDSSLRVEKLPGSRFKLPLSMRTNMFIADEFVMRLFYRFYADSWGLKAHTAQLEPVFKVNSFFSLIPHYRFSSQSGINYFAPYLEHIPSAQFYTSDFDLSKFTSQLGGLGFRLAPPQGVFGLSSWKSVEVRYGYYKRSTGLSAHTLSLSVSIR